jgi:apolipoprotein N-acyltransferase
LIAILCAAASALAFILALGTGDVWMLAWLAPVPVLWLAFGGDSALRIGAAAAAAYFVGQLGMLWPYRTAMGPLAFAVAVVPALAFAATVLATRLASRRLPSTTAAALTFPALWTGWEMLSATLSPHGTFGAWAYSQLSAPVMVQSASLLGLWIVGFLIALFASCLALAVRRRAWRPIAIACALLLVNVAFGAWTLAKPAMPTMRVAGAARDHDDSASADDVAIAQAAEVKRLAAQGAKVVVFEEKAALLSGVRRDVVLAPLVAAARESGATVVAGFDQTSPDRRNVAFTISPDGRVRTYTKRHHIPGLERQYTVGSGAGLLGGGEAVAICKDFDFQATLRHDASAGADAGGVTLMFAPAWDFGADGWLHARMAILRGVEGGYAVVRAASNGLVTVSDAQGRVRARHESGATRYASAIADVPLGTGQTLYVRIGDVFGWLAGGMGLLLVAMSVRVVPRATTASALSPPAPAPRPS